MTATPVIESVGLHALPRSLLLEADPDERALAAYPADATGLQAELSGQVVGVCVLAPAYEHEMELLNIAVAPDVQGRGVGGALLRAAIETAADRGVRRLTLGTGAFGHQLRFYQRYGFRVVEVERDYFLIHYDEPLWEAGIRHRDRLRLALDFSEQAAR